MKVDGRPTKTAVSRNPSAPGRRTASALAGLLSLFALVALALAQTSGPLLVSDKEDYSPGELAVLTGTGFQSGEGVDLSITIDQPDTGTHVADYTWVQFTTDPAGAFVVEWEIPAEAAHTTLTATAMGLSSGLIARATFTDGNIGVHNFNFNATGLPDGVEITISSNAPATGGTHTVSSATQSFVTPNTSSDRGTTVSSFTANFMGSPHTHGNFSVSFGGFPVSVPASGGAYNLTGISFTAGTVTAGVNPGNLVVDLTTGTGSFTTGGPNNMGGTATKVTGAYTFVPTATNDPPTITCLDPTAALSQIIGKLNGTFSATVPISYQFVDGTVKATFDLDTDLTVAVAAVVDPDSDALTVNVDGPSAVTLDGPGSVSALLSILAGSGVDITANDGQNPEVSQACDLTVEAQITYRFVGFGAPLGDESNTRLVKRGSTVPVKFRLYDSMDVEICTDLGAGPARDRRPLRFRRRSLRGSGHR